MKHTRQEVASLDNATIQFCIKWLQDAHLRFKYADTIRIAGKQKQAIKEARTSGILDAIAHLEVLSEHNKKPQTIAQTFNLI